MTTRLISPLSKIIIGSVLLSNTAYAYPVEYFIPQEPSFQQEVQEFRVQPTGVQQPETQQPQIDTPIIPRTSLHVTRAEFVKSIVEDMYPRGIPATCFEQLSPSNYWLLFRDVPKEANYGPQLCAAMIMGFVNGYPDVSFRPLRPINFAEASKILAKAHGLASDSSDPTVEWYTPYVEAMRAHNALPADAELDDYVTPNAMAFMVGRLARG